MFFLLSSSSIPSAALTAREHRIFATPPPLGAQQYSKPFDGTWAHAFFPDAHHIASKRQSRTNRGPGWWLAVLVLLHAGALPATSTFDSCFIDAGNRYRIAPSLLEAIANAESGFDPTARNANRNGSVDRGLMQINSRWLPELSQHGIDEEALWEPCLSIHVGAWILAQNIQRYGYTWTAVGAYNAGTGHDAATERRRRAYAERVARHLPRAPAVRMRDIAGNVTTREGNGDARLGGRPRDRAAVRQKSAPADPLVRHMPALPATDGEDAHGNSRDQRDER